MKSDPFGWIGEDAEARSRLGLTRTLRTLGRSAPGRLECEGRQVVEFASNDYLGLASDPRVVNAASVAAARFGWGAGASPLISGWSPPHQELAEALAAFEGTEAIAMFPTGYAANLGTIASLVGPGDVVYEDRLNHSCLIQGARFSGATLRIYPHSEHGRLARMLDRDRGRFRRILIATDGVFSMDGDLAPIRELVELADRFGAMLLVDEAHGTGVFGTDGRGASSAQGVSDRVPVRVGTLSKAIGSIGGFVAGSGRIIEHLVNRAPTLMFSTAMPPAAAAAASESLRIIDQEPWRRGRVFELAERLRRALRGKGIEVPPSEGPIVPVILGDSERAMAASLGLYEGGFIVPAIRPPTVPRGSARLRISVSASHEPAEIDALAETLTRVLGAS